MASVNTGTLIPNLKELYDEDIFSDLTINCSGGSFKLHKIVLWTQSKYFRSLLGGSFKESKDAVVDLPEDASVMKALFRYCYHFTFEDTYPQNATYKSCYIIQVYAAADKYDIPQLRSLASARLSRVCGMNGTNDLIAAIREIDETTIEPTLKNIVLSKIKDRIPELIKQQDFADLLIDLPSFNKDLLMYLTTGQVDAIATSGSRTSMGLTGDAEFANDGDDDDDDYGDDDDDNQAYQGARGHQVPSTGASSQWRCSHGNYGPGRRLG